MVYMLSRHPWSFYLNEVLTNYENETLIATERLNDPIRYEYFNVNLQLHNLNTIYNKITILHF